MSLPSNSHRPNELAGVVAGRAPGVVEMMQVEHDSGSVASRGKGEERQRTTDDGL